MTAKKDRHPFGCHPEGACELRLLALNSPRSSRASTKRPFVEFANRIPCDKLHGRVRWCGGATKKKGTPLGVPFFFGGATRNRTGDRGVADLCLTAWPWRLICFQQTDYITKIDACQGVFKYFLFISCRIVGFTQKIVDACVIKPCKLD